MNKGSLIKAFIVRVKMFAPEQNSLKSHYNEPSNPNPELLSMSQKDWEEI
jgi:hypothetical protein